MVLRWLREESPDVLCMQEIKVENELFPSEPFRELGYSLAVNGQKSWNGVAIASRIGFDDVRKDLPGGFLKEQKRTISAVTGDIRVVNVYVPNGGDVTLDRFQDKLRYLDELGAYADALSAEGPLVVMGDFNVAPGPDDVYDPEALEGSICFHPEERARVSRMIAGGFHDAYRLFNPTGKAFSWWDYRAMAFRRKRGMRLDLVLLNEPATELAEGCEIQADPRKWEKPSDHAPVLLTIQDRPRE